MRGCGTSTWVDGWLDHLLRQCTRALLRGTPSLALTCLRCRGSSTLLYSGRGLPQANVSGHKQTDDQDYSFIIAPANTQMPSVSPAMEARVFSTVAQLTTLKSLLLTTNFNPASISPEAVRPQATCVGRLSALTALTQLQLIPSSSYEHHGDSWSVMERDGDRHGTWCEVREAHRASLLSALRCMPQLQHLYCPALWLQPSELAPLTALTRVTLMGLLPPAVGRPSGQEDGGLAGLPGASVALPPHLRELVLERGASPRALALLQPSPAFSLLDVQLMRFGVSDVTAGGHMRAEAVAAVGPAVRLLTVYRNRASESSRLVMDCDSGHGLLRPRANAPTGHMEWIRQLRGLDAFGSVEISNMALLAADLSCLGQTLCNITGEPNARQSVKCAAGLQDEHASCDRCTAQLERNLGCKQVTITGRICTQAWSCRTAPSQRWLFHCCGTLCSGCRPFTWTSRSSRASLSTARWSPCCWCCCAGRTLVPPR